MSHLEFIISRFDGQKRWLQTYYLTYQPGRTVFWWLDAIKQEQDPSLTLAVSCRAGLCGACGVKVNGRPVLACDTQLDALLNGSFSVKIEPLPGFPVIRDLLLDWRPATDSLKGIQPWLEAKPQFGCNGGCTQTTAEYQTIKPLVACIACGICAAVCPALTHDGFIEPFVLVKAQRVAADSRSSGASRQRVIGAVRKYLPNCLHCGLCEQACPKGVSPLKAIVELSKCL